MYSNPSAPTAPSAMTPPHMLTDFAVGAPQTPGSPNGILENNEEDERPLGHEVEPQDLSNFASISTGGMEINTDALSRPSLATNYDSPHLREVPAMPGWNSGNGMNPRLVPTHEVEQGTTTIPRSEGPRRDEQLSPFETTIGSRWRTLPLWTSKIRRSRTLLC